MAGPTGVVLNSGSGGATCGVDSDGTYDYQIVKIGYSVAGSTPTQVSASNPLPVSSTANLTQLAGTAVKTGSGNGSAGSLNVYIGTDQPTLTNAQPVLQSGTWTVGQGSPPWTIKPDGTVWTLTGTAANVNLTNASIPVTGTFWQATQPISGTVSINGMLADASAFTRGTTVELPVGGVVEAIQSGLTVGQTRALSLTATAALRVDGSAVVQPVSGTFWQTIQPVSGTVTANQGTANATPWNENLAQVGGTAVALGQTTMSASIPVVISSNQSAIPALQSGTWTVAQGSPNTPANAWPVTLVPQTGNGWSKFSTPKNNSNTPLTATVVQVKGSAGELGGYIVYNPNASVAYVQVFDAATTGAVTLGTTRPDIVIPVPPTSGANLEFANGVNFTSGIQIAATTTDSGSTAPGTGLTVTMAYK
ncbi:MAG: hypothetical protein ACYDAE_23145 [Steroidobacteraceae bacterium]